MAEQHVQLMKGLGFNDEQIQSIETMTPEQLKEFKPDELVTTVQTSLKNVLQNDPAFLAAIPKEKINPAILKEIEKGQYARFQNELVEVATKKLGLDDKDLTDEDKKSIKGLAEKMANVYLSKKGNVEGLKEMQTKYSEAMQSLETLKEQNTQNLTKELEKVNGQHTAKLIKTLTKVELASLSDVTLSVGANFISDPVLSALSAKYAVVIDANDNLDIKQKANPELEVLDSAGKKITFAQALKSVVLDNKLGVEAKTEDPNDPTKKKKVIIGGGGGAGGGTEAPVASYITDKINANGDLP